MSQTVERPNVPGIEIKGQHLLLLIILPLTLVVGAAFMWLSPIVTAKKPGHLYIGLRFSDERSVQFIDKNITNPLVTFEVFSGETGTTGTPLHHYEELRRGKNIIDLSDLPDATYLLHFQSEGYRNLTITMEKLDGEFRDTPAKVVPQGSKVMDQFVGVVMLDATTR